jgi:tRNA(Ile)-lysidine synthase
MKRLNVSSRLSRDFPPDGRYLIGVSGGRDSVALLHCLVNLGYQKLIVCHLNHQLRGCTSLADARFGENIARKYHAEFELESANVRDLATKRKMSIEMAAREARYKFFAETARRRKCRIIFLAHHADDLVESFLINLFRGAGTAGLGGMREISTRRIDNVDLAIVRPLLSVWRKEIDVYVRQHRIKFREDASNKNLNPLRNRIRHRIIPYLEEIVGRNIRPAIWRTAAVAAEEEDWIENQLSTLGEFGITCVSQICRDLPAKELRRLPVALQRRAIVKWLRAQNVSEVGFDVIERVRSLVDPAATTAKVNLSQDRHARRRSGRIFVE